LSHPKISKLPATKTLQQYKQMFNRTAKDLRCNKDHNNSISCNKGIKFTLEHQKLGTTTSMIAFPLNHLHSMQHERSLAIWNKPNMLLQYLGKVFAAIAIIIQVIFCKKNNQYL
jgi:hypothetical protein